MKTKIKSFLKLLVIAIAVVATNVSSFYIGCYTKNNEWKKDLLRLDIAEYDRKTGEWQMVQVSRCDLFQDLPILENPIETKNSKK